MKKNLTKYYALIPVALLCGYYIAKAMHFPAHDFANYYFGGKFLAEGRFDSWVYFPYEFNKAIAESGHRSIFANYAPNTPFLALFFMPFSLLPLVISKLVFNVLSAVLLLFSLKRLADFHKIPPIYLLLIPVLFFVPIKNGILFGQVYFALFFLLSESWLAYEKKAFLKMAILLSLAILLKVFPILLILVFVFRKQFRPLFYVLIGCGLLLLASAIVSGTDIWLFYLKTVLPRASNGEISTAFVPNYQSVFMFLKQLLVPDKIENPDAIFNNPGVFHALVLAFKIKLLVIGFYVTRKSNNSFFVFAYWIFAALLISPYGSTYSFILLLPVFFALVKSPTLDVWKIITGVLLFFAANFPLALILQNTFPFSYLRLFALLSLFAIFLWWFYPYINKWKLTAIIIIPSLLVLFFHKTVMEKAMVLTGKNSPILIYDYVIANGKLTYFYWNENGENTQSFPFEVGTTNPAEITNNQIFYDGKQYTFDKSNKQKPLIVDHKYVVYLSDEGCGIGFYTLRQTALK